MLGTLRLESVGHGNNAHEAEPAMVAPLPDRHQSGQAGPFPEGAPRPPLPHRLTTTAALGRGCRMGAFLAQRVLVPCARAARSCRSRVVSSPRPACSVQRAACSVQRAANNLRCAAGWRKAPMAPNGAPAASIVMCRTKQRGHRPLFSVLNSSAVFSFLSSSHPPPTLPDSSACG